MGPVGGDDSKGEILTQLIGIVREISALPECKSPSRNMWSSLVRRVRLLSPLFDELVAGDGQGKELFEGIEGGGRGEDEVVEPNSAIDVGALGTLWVALNSAKELLIWVNQTSKLYQAMHRNVVSSKFLKATEDIEEALCAINYDKLNLSEDVREQIELVHAQFRRATCKVDPPDTELVEDMEVVQIEPNPEISVLKRLSDSLQLRTIEDLRKESRAFHEMVITGDGELGDSFEMMSSIFRKLNDYLLTLNPEVDHHNPENGSYKHRSLIIPDDFRCPMSSELMKDPVIIATGQTYERACIQKWLVAGHRTCPKTLQTLSHTTLTPNYVLKSLITLWCETNGLELPEKQGASRNQKSGRSSLDCDRSAIGSLLAKLVQGSIEEQRAAAGELRLLAKRNADNRVCIAEAGAIPLLVELLSSDDPRTQEHAVTTLLNLSINEANKGLIVQSGAIADIVEVLKKGSMEARENAAATLFSLSFVDENKVAIGAVGAIPALIDLLCEGTPRGKKDAAKAIFNLSIYQGNKVRAVRAGIMGPLMGLLRDVGCGMVDEAIAILAILSSHPEGKIVIGGADPVPVLVDVMRTGSGRNRENAAVVLWSLCVGDREHLKRALSLGAGDVLKELSENGTDRGKRKAASLLEMLQKLENGQ